MKNVGRRFERGYVVRKLRYFWIGRIEFGDFLIKLGELRAEKFGCFWMFLVMDNAERTRFVRNFLEKTSLLTVADMLCYSRDRIELEGTLNFAI